MPKKYGKEGLLPGYRPQPKSVEANRLAAKEAVLRAKGRFEEAEPKKKAKA